MSGFLPTTVYGVSYQGSTLPGGNSSGLNPGGAVVGQVLVLNNGPYGGYNMVMLVQAGAEVPAFAACKFSDQATYQVIATAAAGDLVAGINDLAKTAASQGSQGTAGQIVTSGNYFYMNIWGPCKVLMGAGVLEGKAVVPTAVAGTLDSFVDPGTTAVAQLANISASAASGAGGATLAYQR